jgi:HD superfamily phosphodiesterase
MGPTGSSHPTSADDRIAVRRPRYAPAMTNSHRADALAWAARAPEVPDEWFSRPGSHLHGAGHTKRVHVHAQRLLEELRWSTADAGLVLCAALWHDIGRTGDGVEPDHGRLSAGRADDLGLTAALTPSDADIVRFAILRHSLPDRGAPELAADVTAGEGRARRLAEPERALRVLWLLKDADALDRVRLGLGESADPRQLRHRETIALIPFASALYAVPI